MNKSGRLVPPAFYPGKSDYSKEAAMKKLFLLSLLFFQSAAHAGAYIPLDKMLDDEDKAAVAKMRAKARYLGDVPEAGDVSSGSGSPNSNCSLQVGNIKNDNRAGKINPREVKVIVLGNITNASDCKK
jgi:hypothetical protein